MIPNATVTVTSTMTPKKEIVLWFVVQNMLLIRASLPFGKDVSTLKKLEYYSTTGLVYLTNVALVMGMNKFLGNLGKRYQKFIRKLHLKSS
jgi:hypothetical protein